MKPADATLMARLPASWRRRGRVVARAATELVAVAETWPRGVWVGVIGGALAWQGVVLWLAGYGRAAELFGGAAYFFLALWAAWIVPRLLARRGGVGRVDAVEEKET